MNDDRFVETYDTGTVADNSVQSIADLIEERDKLKKDLDHALQSIRASEIRRPVVISLLNDRDEIAKILGCESDHDQIVTHIKNMVVERKELIRAKNYLADDVAFVRNNYNEVWNAVWQIYEDAGSIANISTQDTRWRPAQAVEVFRSAVSERDKLKAEVRSLQDVISAREDDLACLSNDRDEIAEILGCESDHDSIKKALYSRICDRHLTLLQNEFHARSRAAGWWSDDPITPETVAVKLVLIHSEISEALEGVRKDKMDDHLPHRKACEVELADAVIRILDLAGALGYDIGAAISEKMAYNASRADHKLENRAAPGGKVF